MRSQYPSSTQVDYDQSSSRSLLSTAGEHRGSRAGRFHRSHTSSASLQEDYEKVLHYNLLGVGSQFADFGSTHRYRHSLPASRPPEDQPIHENHLHIGRNSAKEQEALGSMLDTDPVDEGESRQ